MRVKPPSLRTARGRFAAVPAAISRIPYRVWVGLVLGVVGAIAVASAVTFPDGLGYDALAHRTYADLLVHHGHIPSPSESQEFHTPPGFYAVAGAAEAVASGLGATDPWQVARALNVAWVLGAAILTLLIARELFPRDRLLQVAALAFAGLVPVVLKLAAMLHPETLSLFASTLALYLAVRTLVRRSYGWRAAVVLGVALGAAQLVRGANLWLVPVVLAGFAAAALGDAEGRRRVVSSALVVLAATAVVAGPWYVRQTVEYSNPVAFNRPAPDVPLWRRRPLSFYTGLGLPQSIDDPTRPQFVNELIPTLYSEIWGDYFGYFAWTTAASGTTPVPLDPTGLKELKAQNVLGLVPTLLATGGVLGLLWASLRRGLRRADPGLLVIALLPIVGLLGFLLFTVTYPSGDGDVIKAAYVLTTVPGWALGFGYAWRSLARFRPALVVASAACGLALVSDLVFLLHRGSFGPL
jgi:hypothetical protein